MSLESGIFVAGGQQRKPDVSLEVLADLKIYLQLLNLLCHILQASKQ